MIEFYAATRHGPTHTRGSQEISQLGRRCARALDAVIFIYIYIYKMLYSSRLFASFRVGRISKRLIPSHRSESNGSRRKLRSRPRAGCHWLLLASCKDKVIGPQHNISPQLISRRVLCFSAAESSRTTKKTKALQLT